MVSLDFATVSVTPGWLEGGRVNRCYRQSYEVPLRSEDIFGGKQYFLVQLPPAIPKLHYRPYGN